MSIGVSIGAAFGAGWTSYPVKAVLIVALTMGIVGFTDDLRPLPPLVRLVAQALGGVVLSVLLFLDGPLIVVVAGTIWMIGYINAFNFMDGVNGISAMSASVAGVTFLFCGLWYGAFEVALLGGMTAASALAFLPFNLVSKRIFLGDVGSYFYGCLIGGTVLLSLLRGIPAALAISPLSIYLLDTSWTLARRAAHGKPVIQPHREHIYQRLLSARWSHGHSALLAATGALCAVGAAALSVAGYTALGLIAIATVLSLYLVAPRILANETESIVWLSSDRSALKGDGRIRRRA